MSWDFRLLSNDAGGGTLTLRYSFGGKPCEYSRRLDGGIAPDVKR